MKTLYSFLFLFILSYTTFSQDLEWANLTYGTGADVLLDIATDQEGNIYSTGFFSNDTYFNNQSEKFNCDGH